MAPTTQGAAPKLSPGCLIDKKKLPTANVMSSCNIFHFHI